LLILHKMCDNHLTSDLIIGLVGGLSAGTGIWIIDRMRECYLFIRDEKRIVKFFNEKIMNDEFRNTYRIASEVNLTEDRVRYICSNSKEIKRNEKKDEVWSLR